LAIIFFLISASENFSEDHFTLRLNQAAADDTGHATPPELTQAKSLLCARWCRQGLAAECERLGGRQQTPSVVHPARELAGDLADGNARAKEALIAYRRVLAPGRRNAGKG